MRRRAGRIFGMVFILVFLAGALPAAAQFDGPDLVVVDAPGWDACIVPKLSASANPAVCEVDYPLGNPFYWNVTGRNMGNEATPTGFDVTFYVDGDVAGMGYADPTSDRYYVINQGPVSLDLAGRHTLSAYADALHIIDESFETNNSDARQYVFPLIQLPGLDQVLVRSTLPSAIGGHSHRDWDLFPTFDANCDGSTFYNTEDGWQVVVVRRLEEGGDIEADLYSAITPGLLDIVLSASNQDVTNLEGFYLHVPWMDVESYNLGVNGWGDGGYRVVRRGAESLTLNVPRSVHFDADQDVAMFKFALSPLDQGRVNIALETNDDVTLWMDHLDPDHTYDTINYGHDGRVLTNGHGQALWTETVDDGREHAVVVFRDPFVDPGPIDFEIIVRNDRPNLQPYKRLMVEDVVVVSSREPSMGYISQFLYGDSNATYWDYVIKNTGAVDAGRFSDRLYVDGVAYPTILHLAGLESWGEYGYSGITPTTVRGGRHTVGLMTEVGNDIDEVLEKDNAYVRQLHWLPADLWYGGSLTRAAPPARDAGWKLADPGQELLPNFDALRLPAHDPTGGDDHWWRGLAVLPEAGTDLELTLLTPYIASTSGFADTLATSNQIAGRTDFVAVNMNLVDDPSQPYDVGIARDAGSGSYTANSAGSVYLPRQTSGAHGPFQLVSGELLHLMEVELDPGLVTIGVDNRSGYGRLGLCLIDHSAETFSLAHPVGQLAREEAAVEGQDVDFTLTLSESGKYALAVYRVVEADPARPIDYLMLVYPGVTDAPEVLPNTVLLGPAQPNPFNPMTTIRYALPRSAHVRLAVYDLQGRLIRTLCNEVRPAGGSMAEWNGRDDSGLGVSSGVYFCILETEGAHRAMKVTLLR